MTHKVDWSFEASYILTYLITVVMTLVLVLVVKLGDEVIHDINLGRKYHGLYFQPGPPVDPRASVGFIADTR